MIRKSLDATKRATYSVSIPSPVPEHRGMPIANGTGFFVSAEGHFVTALHVVQDVDPTNIWLQQHADRSSDGFGGGMVQWPELVQAWPEFDLAVLRADFSRNANKRQLVGLEGFPFIEVELEHVSDGTPVYSYGYPLPETYGPVVLQDGQTYGPVEAEGGTVIVGGGGLGPRTTSAIVASSVEMTRMVMTGGDPQVYVLDKALNYGNSGGPIVMTETGRVFAVCVRFQPVHVPQDAAGNSVMVPSLYGIGSSLANIADFLRGLRTYSRGDER